MPTLGTSSQDPGPADAKLLNPLHWAFYTTAVSVIIFFRIMMISIMMLIITEIIMVSVGIIILLFRPKARNHEAPEVEAGTLSLFGPKPVISSTRQVEGLGFRV